MRLSRTMLLTLLRFAVLYGLLLAPWPGACEAYGRYLRGLGAAAFARDDSRSIVRFRPAEHPPRPEIDTEIVTAPRATPDAAGNVPCRILCLDTRGVGWVPTALLLALVLASPVPWHRRLRALGTGLLLLHAYLVLLLAVFLWAESDGVLPVAWLGYSPAAARILEETLVTQLGLSFVLPVILWLAVTFNAGDRARLFANQSDERSHRNPHHSANGPLRLKL